MRPFFRGHVSRSDIRIHQPLHMVFQLSQRVDLRNRDTERRPTLRLVRDREGHSALEEGSRQALRHRDRDPNLFRV